MKAESLTYVALGDSTAVGVGAQSGGYPDRIARRLGARGTSVKFINLGESGATSADVLADQIPRLADLRPELITLGVGVNDVWRMVDIEEVRSNLQSISAALGKSGAPAVVTNLPDMAHAPIARLASEMLGFTPEMLTAHIERYNSLFDVFLGVGSVSLADLHASSRREFPGHAELFSADGFHPSDAGYESWANLLWARIEKLQLGGVRATKVE